MSLLTQTYNLFSDVYRLEINYYGGFYGELEDFKILKLGEKQIGFEDRDETLVFPTFLEIEIDDFNRTNFTIFESLKKLYQFPQTDLELLTFSIYKNDSLWYKGLLNKLSRRWEDYTLKLQLTTTVEKLNNIRIDNPYLIDELRRSGDLIPETLKNTVGTVFANGYAFGGIGDFDRRLLKGFVILQPAGFSKPVLSLSVDDSPLVTDPNIEKKLGFIKFKNFFMAMLKFINPDINLTIEHNWTFGPEEKTIEDLYLYFVYRDIFGRLIMISREIYNTLDDRIFETDGLRDACGDPVWKDDNWVVWKVNVAGSIISGDNDRSLMQSIKKVLHGFFSRLYIKDLNNAIIYKKGYTDTDEVPASDILPESSQYTQNNKISYVKISWRGKQTAERGENSTLLTEQQKLVYDVMFGAAESETVHINVPGFGGFPAGGSINIYVASYGNLFYRTTTGRVFAVQVNDPNYPAIKKLTQLLAELEWRSKNYDRDQYDVEMWGTGYDINKNLNFTEGSKILGKAMPLQLRINEEENKTILSGRGVI